MARKKSQTKEKYVAGEECGICKTEFRTNDPVQGLTMVFSGNNKHAICASCGCQLTIWWKMIHSRYGA